MSFESVFNSPKLRLCKRLRLAMVRGLGIPSRFLIVAPDVANCTRWSTPYAVFYDRASHEEARGELLRQENTEDMMENDFGPIKEPPSNEMLIGFALGFARR